MARFVVGDKVILARWREPDDDHDIPNREYGEEGVIVGVYDQDPMYYHVVMARSREKWGAYDHMLDPAAPLSPFDTSVRAYISRELGRG